eukprot:CAMPEP_0184667220 /NCGR_PEP_ID=MMETSP0308-20130426/66087_1 /TAXON_ID=38269 /ORGANISM="Gloeochaete witrockiana, Strain SAG 46.84" /LENGTH=426 /DNA_ID=CAMNT_0027112289 /DNA_START=807 /DNA_END=2083 /DNA_ORIENTATION=+
MSVSYDEEVATADVLAGLLPGVGNPYGYTQPVVVVKDPRADTVDMDEGRAMLQNVHAFAPAAKLCFGFGTIDSVLPLLVSPPCNADIILDDLGATTPNPYIDTTGAIAIDAAVDSGVLWFTSAGNSNGHNREFELNMVPSTNSEVPQVLQNIRSIRQWNRFPREIGSEGGGFFLPYFCSGRSLLKAYWNQFQVMDDYDIFYLQNGRVAYQSTTDNLESGNAREELNIGHGFKGHLAIGLRQSISDPSVQRPIPHMWLMTFLNFEYNFPEITHMEYLGSIAGHRAARQVITVSAYNYRKTQRPQAYSNAGPATVFYSPDGELLNGVNGEIRRRPDIGAIDCYDHSYFSSGYDAEGNGAVNFCGTSSAVTFAAAVAGLFKQAVPSLTRAKLLEAFRATGTDWQNQSGYGLLNTDAVMSYLRTGRVLMT